MSACCELRGDIRGRQRRVLQVVLAVNTAMFLAELAVGLHAGSTALLADSGDMLGDAIAYGFSLYVVSRGPIWQARAALLKGAIMATFGLLVFAEVASKLIRGGAPDAGAIGLMAGVALAANAVCLGVLWPRRGDDINMRSAWVCSQNDVIANAGVLLAAAGVALTGSAWPDVVAGLIIAVLFVTSAVAVLRRASIELGPVSPSP
jgi:Co/Zn/Cd efflux system component